jgi:hypothetical protein
MCLPQKKFTPRDEAKKVETTPLPSNTNFVGNSSSLVWWRPCNVAHREYLYRVFALVEENYADAEEKLLQGFTENIF